MARVAQRVAPTPAPCQNLADTTTSGILRRRASRYCHTLLMIDISNASPATPDSTTRCQRYPYLSVAPERAQGSFPDHRLAQSNPCSSRLHNAGPADPSVRPAIGLKADLGALCPRPTWSADGHAQLGVSARAS